MITLALLLLGLAFLLSVGLGGYGWFRRSVEWVLLGAALACWFLAQLVGAGLRVQ